MTPACRLPVSATWPYVFTMAQPNKGPRRVLHLRLDADVYERIERLYTSGAASSISQAGADVLAHAAGLPERARELREASQLGLLQMEVDWETPRSA